MTYDMILVHAPSVYDFRRRNDILFAYLSNSDSVHVSPIFEMPPVGVFAIQQHLEQAGFAVDFFNVASQMLRHPEFDVVEFFERTPARYMGVDLHWLAHTHGALELASLYKEIHPSARTVVGGISSTYYHDELITYPQVDYVVRGHDTLYPLELLLRSNDDPTLLGAVPNLTWKHGGEIHTNPLSHVPSAYGASVDWTRVFGDGRTGVTPYNIVIPQAGCEYNCKWCGGSRRFFQQYGGLRKPVQKTPEMLRRELASLAGSGVRSHTVTMINFWHEHQHLFDAANAVFFDDAINCVHYSLHRLPSVEKVRCMARSVRVVLELSPDSHDMRVGQASGRGSYSMEEMEIFIDALADTVYSFEIYFMLGLPHQTRDNIMETVDYCGHLLEKYAGKRVIPFICPMLPFLDPGSEFFDHPDEHGYTIFHRTLEDHRNALLSMNWRDRLNYETRWLSRDELVSVSYEAVEALTVLKNRYRLLPDVAAREILDLIAKTRGLLTDIDAYQAMSDGPHKTARAGCLEDAISAYNRNQFAMVRSQQRPIDLGFARSQWFDTESAFERVMAS